MTLRFLLTKNRREMLVVEAAQYRGSDFLSARIWYRPDDDPETLKPGREGWTLPLDRLDELIDALGKIRFARKANEKPEVPS